MTLRKICEIKNNQIVITLPEDFKDLTKVFVTVDDTVDVTKEKYLLLKQAANDPLFLNDVKEINDDFNNIDHENL
jgi:hypothetical protein